MSGGPGWRCEWLRVPLEATRVHTYGAQGSRCGRGANLFPLWHTFVMGRLLKSIPEGRVRKHTSAVSAELQPKIGAALKRARKAGASDLRFPDLSGAEAAALMEAAGIVDGKGKLAKKYR